MKNADAASWFQTQQDNDIKYQRKTKQYPKWNNSPA